MTSAFDPATEHVLVRLLVQLAVIVLWARLAGSAAVRLGQSRSVGEILGGVLLGPSVVGWLLPGPSAALFPTDAPNLLPWFSHLGLVLALFLIGADLDVREVRPHVPRVLLAAVASLGASLATGVGLAAWLWRTWPGAQGFPPYALIVGMVVGITAIPILGRVLAELGLTRSRVGVLAVTVGTGKDLLMWILLAVVGGLAHPPVDPLELGVRVGGAFVLAVLAWGVGVPALRAWRAGAAADAGAGGTLVASLAGAFLLAAASASVGLFAIFGAFLAGTVLGTDRALATRVSDRLHDLTVHLFLPVFFTSTGLRCDLGALGVGDVGVLVAVTIVGSLANGGVGALAARWSGLSGREAVAFGALVNLPGLMILILLNVGLDLGVLPRDLFSLLVGSAMLRNLATTPIVRRAARGGLPPIEPRPTGS